MGAELAGLLGGHPQLRDRKLALGSDREPAGRRRLQPCRPGPFAPVERPAGAGRPAGL